MEQPAAGSTRSADRRVWQLAVLMAATATAVAAPGVLEDPLAAVPDLAWLALLPAFALAEVAVLHLPAQRSSHSHSMREIPAIAGLTFLAPQQYVTVYVAGAALALVLWPRLRGVKLAFNTAMFALEATLGVLVYHAVLGQADPIAPRAWAAAVAAVLLTDLISAAAVTTAISLTDHRFDDQVLREALRSGVPAALVNACVALLLVTLISVRPTALPLLAVIVVLLALGYRVYLSLARGYAQVQLLYRFVGSTGRTAEIDEVIPAMLAEAAQLLQASSACLLTVGSEGTPLEGWTWEDGQITHERRVRVAGSAWWAAAVGGTPVLRAADDGRDQAGPRDGIAVPLVEDGVVSAVLMVTDRSFEEETFTDSDLHLFEALAAHARVALDKALVLERLRRAAEEQAHEATHDQLTGLPNRRAFLSAVHEAMHRGEHGVVLLLDLDDFKDVNDTLGHSAGDRLLSVTGERLADEVSGLVARLGGDEFAILVTGTQADHPAALAARLQGVVGSPVPLRHTELHTTATVGIAGFRAQSCTSEELLAHADVAMSAAKAARTDIATYRPEDGESTARRLRLASDLPAALREGRLELWYQPQADCARGGITGVEALLRWPHPDFGMVPPPEVVAIAQRTGLMHALSHQIVERALEQRRVWHLAGHELDVSVNIAAADLGDPTLVEHVQLCLDRTVTPAGALVLELTESDELGDLERSMSVLHRLARIGVRLSVDDFGTGYSSLAYLDQLPVHEVKIDQSFVVRLEKAADATIVRATVGLAHELGLRVVAEGVESDLSRQLVTELGCDLFQGYGLARPMPAAEVLGWLERRSGWATTLRGPWVAAG